MIWGRVEDLPWWRTKFDSARAGPEDPFGPLAPRPANGPYGGISRSLGSKIEFQATARAGRFAYRSISPPPANDPYSKEEPPLSLSGRRLPGKKRLDFICVHPECGGVAVEAKNVRPWLYPNEDEVVDLIAKAVALDSVPVLIARRIPFVTSKLLLPCGVVMHQTYNQLYPAADHHLAEKARDRRLLGYHDIRVGNQPDARLVKFIGSNLPRVLPGARERFDRYKDLLADFGDRTVPYKEFTARVRRRSQGTDEDSDIDWDELSDYL